MSEFERARKLIHELIREIPDFPKPGILFKDLTPVWADPRGLADGVREMAAPYRGASIDRVIGVEARGFVLGAPVALELGAGFIPVRKPGKLPYDTFDVSYALEYGTDTLEMHVDGLRAGERVLIVDDLLATGGTAAATLELVRKADAEVVGFSFLVELAFLEGRSRLGDERVETLLTY